jgi:hypothetical protein
VPVAVLIGVGVVLAEVGHPVDDGALDRQGPEEREYVARGRVRLERAVSPHPVEADSHAITTQEVHQPEYGDVGPDKASGPTTAG